MRACGLERNSERARFHGTVDDGRRFEIFTKQIFPGLHFSGMDQQDGTGNVSGLGEILIGAVFHVNHTHVLMRGQRWRPGDGDQAELELLGINHGHFRCAFAPGNWQGEILGVDAVGAGGFEGFYAPLHRFLHCGSTWDASTDAVGQVVQVSFDW